MKEYDHLEIESKWQKEWESSEPNKVTENQKGNTAKKKFYALIEFPYPSGDGMHVGHIRSNTAMDVISRKRRAEGYNVLYPIGWDAFGLPTENYAIKTGIQPALVTKQNTDIFRRQLKALGFSFDWSREINTTDPKYYKWTQWIFLQFLKKGLAYKKKMTINWCPKDLIGLANEEVIDGCCERCGTKVEKKEKEQWMLAITKYAERLDKDLDETEFLEKIKIQQRNWIGKSEGAEIDFAIKTNENNSDKKIKVFTTRPDTLFGVTYIVLAPEHTFVKELLSKTSNKDEVQKYVADSKVKTDIERTDAKSEKTGVELKGIKAINPANNEEIPVWISDYVLADYGTGAVMAVPAHDERDWDFAKKYGLKMRQVIEPMDIATSGSNKVLEGAPFVSREAISVIVKHWSEDKYLGLKWKKVDWGTFVTGGVESGQTPEQAAMAEIQEETGYQNLQLIKSLGKSHSKFYHVPKKENRLAHFESFYFELKDGERKELTEDEKEKHEVVWLSPEEINKFLTPESQKRDWKIIKEGNFAYIGEGLLTNSNSFNGKDSESVKKEITESVGGTWVTKFKLRDWIFSRQRYWGEPIPVVHCEKCGIVPVPEKELPIELPEVKNYQPTQTGESPLASIDEWVNTKCPNCKGPAKRETDTMPNWAGSSWYYLRYADPNNAKAFADKKNLEYWTPVDWYNGGMEHTTLHLLYSRFWHKFLFDLGLVPTSEPYKKRTSHGLILAEGGEKMSKSKGNVINPDGIVKIVGADTLRIHEMFMGPFDQAIAWDSNTIAGSRRFVERVWKLQEKIGASQNSKIDVTVHKTIKKVTDDIEAMRFNTAISSMMILLNEFEKESVISKENYSTFIQLLAPFAPHVTEELWVLIGNNKSVHASDWPKYDQSKMIDSTVNIMIQVNGKMRGMVEAKIDADEEEIKNMALNMSEIQKWVDGKEIKKVIFVKGKVINIVV
jgi:leucyl-tRNA synthetase